MPPEGPIAKVKDWVYGFFNLPPWTPPSASTLAEFLDEEVIVAEVGNSGMRRILFRHSDPSFAVDLLRWIHREGDELIREEAQERTSRQIDYIESKLATITVVEQRFSLVQLLSDQEKRMMMIKVDLPFAARIVQPPTASEAPTFPDPGMILLVAVIAGVVLGVLLVFLISALRGEPKKD